MATAAQIRSNIKKLEAALKSKATPKTIKAKLETQLSKNKSDLASLKSGKPTKKTTTKTTKSALDNLSKLLKGKKFGVYKGAGVDLKKDAERPAKPIGKRKSASGNTYYEYRANRIDVKQPSKKATYPKLEEGGYMAKGGKIENQYEGRTASDIWKNLDSSQRYEFLLDHEDVILGLKEAKELPQGFNGQQKRLDWSKLDKDVKKAFEQHTMWGEYKQGGYMAKGGEMGKFKVDDVVYHKGHNTVGIVRVEEERGEVKTDADGNVNADELEYFNPMKNEAHKNAKIAPSTQKEIEERGLWKPFSSEKSFDKGAFDELLNESVEHLWQGYNKLEQAMNYLRKTGQGGLINSLKAKLDIEKLEDAITSVDAVSSKYAMGGELHRNEQ